VSNDQPAVSVVIPSHRGGKFLREAIASVQSQSLTDWELIIVLDGCDDDLSDIENDDRRVRVFRQRRRGISISRNVGVAHSHADLIAFLDHDDRMLPDRLSVQLQAMEDESIGMCHSQFRIINGQGDFVTMGSARSSQYLDMLAAPAGILLSSVMIRKSLLQEIGGFDSVLPLSQDIDLFYRVARETKLHFIPQAIVEYRRHGDNTWGNTLTSGGDVRVILTQHLWAAEAEGDTEMIRAIKVGLSKDRVTEAAVAVLQARAAYSKHEYQEVTRTLLKALLLSPKNTLREVVGNRYPIRLLFSRSNAKRRSNHSVDLLP
jgi:glycosyltransferase involved in cell wall biosynthesis